MYIKEIDKSNLKIEWFFYSTVSNTTPDYLIASNGAKVDTICTSDNIANVDFVNDFIKISFYGEPTCYNKPILVTKKVFGFEIKIDSSHVLNEPKSREFYKK